MSILIKNIKQLLQTRENAPLVLSAEELKSLPILENAWLHIENDRIQDYGLMENCPQNHFETIIDATGKIVLPTWCDSHTHLVYAGNRVQEFADRIHGLSYEEIANRGGGILNSAKRLNDYSEEDLFAESVIRLKEVMALGTGAIEIKSGYGLNLEAEMKMLRVIKRLGEEFPVTVKATFLGAHAFPTEFKENQEAYIDQLVDVMIPAVAKENLAEYVDVFCEKGYFSVEQTERILAAGNQHGLKAKIHVNQFNAIGGIEAAVKHNAVSVDHLEIVNPEDIEALKGKETIAVALPLCSFFISIPYTPARQMLDSGVTLALATDYNPGTAPSGNMNLCVATACIKMKMTPEEAINAATINGAYAMGVSDEFGSITKGKIASVIITKDLTSYSEIPYSFGSNPVNQVILKGKIIA